MNGIARFAVTRPRIAWMLVILASLLIGAGAGELARITKERAHLSKLQTKAERSSFEITLQTLNGNQMGALALLGLVDANIKREAKGELAPNSKDVFTLMVSLARAHDADGAFVVGQDGIIKSSWGIGKPLTGVDVKFRPYAQMALKGKENVYAAIGTTTGRRNLYFAAPLYAGNISNTPVIGAVVGRTGVARLDKLLDGKADIALLLSPQGLVFAGNRAEWIGQLVGQPTPERIKAIREIKQFGTMFDRKDPEPLPVAVGSDIVTLGGVPHAVARAKVQWNDPGGDWTLVLLEDLSRSTSAADRIRVGVASGLSALLLGILLLQILRGRHAQITSAHQLQAHAERQERVALQKSRVAQISLQLQQATTAATLAQTFLHQANKILGVLQGAVYVAQADTMGQLTLVAGYGCAADLPATLPPGDGLVGQCALEGKPILIEVPSQTYWRISSGLGAAMPQMVTVMPIQHNDTVLGVIELATLHPLNTDDMSLLNELMPLLALNLEILRRNQHAEKMLATTVAAERELERMAEVERFNRLAQGREQRIIEVKRLANELALKSGVAIPFPVLEATEDSPDEDDVAVVGDHANTGNLTLGDLVDLDELQVLFSNFCEAVGVAAAIIDLEGKVLVSSRWQRACTDFHRVNTDSCARCIESDTELALKLQDGANFTMYRCKNGMTDCASPIIVEGRYLANVFIGQFHLGTPNLTFFTQQARQYHYHEADYLKAVSEAPVMDEKRLPMILGFLTGFARMVTSMSLARRRADEAQQRLQRERFAVMSLAEDADQARRALETRNLELKS